MGYCNISDLKKFYPKIDDLGMNNAEINFFIAKADTHINARLARVYAVPFTEVPSTPPVIRSLSQDLTISFLYNRRHITQSKRNRSDNFPKMEEQAEILIDRLIDENDGLSIVTSAGLIIERRTDQSQILMTVSDYKPTFDLRNIVEQRIDPDRLDDTDNEDV